MQLFQEQDTQIKATLPKKDPTKKQAVFYNSIMKSNRDLSILLLNSLPKKELHLALPLAGSGIRAFRFLQELKPKKIKQIFVNDIKDNFIKTFQQNLKLNQLTTKKLQISNQDANLFLLTQHHQDYCGYFDYIDLDPFGTPNPFLSSAVARLTNNAILAVTATDTAALTGTYLNATKRKYWAQSLKNYLMHETGLRIIIRKIQLQALQFDKALFPILAYHKDHYFRLYFQAKSYSKKDCDQIIKQHQYLLYNPKTLEFKTSIYNKEDNFLFAGPLWTGPLQSKKLLQTMLKQNPYPAEQKFLETLHNEKDTFGFYDLHQIAKLYKIKTPPLTPQLLQKLNASRTHFSPTGIKTKLTFQEIIKILTKR